MCEHPPLSLSLAMFFPLHSQQPKRNLKREMQTYAPFPNTCTQTDWCTDSVRVHPCVTHAGYNQCSAEAVLVN